MRAHMRALEEEDRMRDLHAEARVANACEAGGGFRFLRAAGFAPVVDIDGRLAVVLPFVDIRGPGKPSYMETRFYEDVEAVN